VERVWYNSRRQRMCPPCAWVQVARWLGKQKARLLACDHYHVIFTMPHELNDLWLANVERMSGLLFASVHDTLLEPNPAPASAYSLSGDRWWPERVGPVGGRKQRVSAADASGRCVYPSSSSLGAGSSMCLRREPCGYAVGACTPTRTGQRWRCAGSMWAKNRWRRPHHGTGRTRARHGMRCVGSGVRSVGSGWCARSSSPAPASHRRQRQVGSRWHEGKRGSQRPQAGPKGRGVAGSGGKRALWETARLKMSLPRRIAVPIAHDARDVGRERERHWGGRAIQFP
jgi:hypothetical protein